MGRKQSVVGFNHILKNLSKEEIHLLYSLYLCYHRKTWCYKKAYQKFKKRDMVFSAATALITTGGLADTAVFVPAVAIGGCGFVLGVAMKKNYPRKIELTRYAYTSFEKVLHQLKEYLRGDEFHKEVLMS